MKIHALTVDNLSCPELGKFYAVDTKHVNYKYTNTTTKKYLFIIQYLIGEYYLLSATTSWALTIFCTKVNYKTDTLFYLNLQFIFIEDFAQVQGHTVKYFAISIPNYNWAWIFMHKKLLFCRSVFIKRNQIIKFSDHRFRKNNNSAK